MSCVPFIQLEAEVEADVKEDVQAVQYNLLESILQVNLTNMIVHEMVSKFEDASAMSSFIKLEAYLNMKMNVSLVSLYTILVKFVSN